jgi:hypothetical protein
VLSDTYIQQKYILIIVIRLLAGSPGKGAKTDQNVWPLPKIKNFQIPVRRPISTLAVCLAPHARQNENINDKCKYSEARSSKHFDKNACCLGAEVKCNNKRVFCLDLSRLSLNNTMNKNDNGVTGESVVPLSRDSARDDVGGEALLMTSVVGGQTYGTD